MARKLLVGVIAWFAFVSVACGTVDGNVHLTFTADGKISARLSFKGTGVLGEMLAGEEGPLADMMLSGEKNQDASKDSDIWEVQKTKDGDTTTLTAATRHPVVPEELPLLAAQSQRGLFKNVNWTTGGNVFVKTYRVRLELTPADDAAPAALGDTGGTIDPETLARMLDPMFKITFAVTMPGEITSTNADSSASDTATWVFNFSGMTREGSLEAETREIVWPAVGVAALGLAGVLGAGVWVVLSRRRAL